MAISANTIFEIRSNATAGNKGGCGFNPANANGIADGVISGGTGNSPTLSSATYAFVAGDVGAWIYFPTQTNIVAGFYQIASVSGGVATLSAASGQAIQVSAPATQLYAGNTVAGCATTGAPTGVTYLVDYSQANSARYTGTDLTGTTTSCTSVANPFTAQMVGNLIAIPSGTGITATWAEIVSVAAGVATLSTSPGASYSVATYYTGGAASLGSATTGATDANLWANIAAASGGRVFIKGGGTYNINGTNGFNNATNLGFLVEGYSSSRGDRPSIASGNQPIMNGGSTSTNLFNTSANSAQNTGFATFWCMTFTSSIAANNYTVSNAAANFVNCAFINTGTGEALHDVHIVSDGQPTIYLACEFISYKGTAINCATGLSYFAGCYIHDSSKGVVSSGSTAAFLCSSCVFAGHYTSAADASANFGNQGTLIGCTVYGAEAKLGLGMKFPATNKYKGTLLSNIFYGLTTAVTGGNAGSNGIDNYNTYSNNTNDVDSAANWQKGPNSQAIAPAFTAVTNVTGSTAKTLAGNKLQDSAQNFTNAGVLVGQYLYIATGTSVTQGYYKITAISTTTNPNDTLTVDVTLAANATSDKVYTIRTGSNFTPSAALSNLGFPSTFPEALATAYNSIGAINPQAAGGSFSFGG